MTIKKRELKKRYNISLDPDIHAAATKFIKDRKYGTLSSVVEALLADFNEMEKRKKADHKDQGKLIWKIICSRKS